MFIVYSEDKCRQKIYKKFKIKLSYIFVSKISTCFEIINKYA